MKTLITILTIVLSLSFVSATAQSDTIYIKVRGVGGSGSSSITAYDSTATATASQTAFPFYSFPTSASYISVFNNGVAIDGSYYTYNAATRILTFTTGRIVGDRIRLHIIQ